MDVDKRIEAERVFEVMAGISSIRARQNPSRG